MAFLSKALGTLGGGLGVGGATGAFGKNVQSFFTGTPERNYQQSTLGPEQMDLFRQLQQSAMGAGAGGAFGDSADYYRNLLSDDSADFDAFAAPELRRFNQETIPGLAEQFAGMGSGALSSSGFRNASINAGRDLSERLGAIRASLRSQGAQGLANIGQQGLGKYYENILRPATPGFLQNIGEGVGKGIGSGASAYFTGGIGG